MNWFYVRNCKGIQILEYNAKDILHKKNHKLISKQLDFLFKIYIVIINSPAQNILKLLKE